jgi:hypothetical protein
MLRILHGTGPFPQGFAKRISIISSKHIHSLNQLAIPLATASHRMPSQQAVMNRPRRFIDTLYCAQGALSGHQSATPVSSPKRRT